MPPPEGGFDDQGGATLERRRQRPREVDLAVLHNHRECGRGTRLVHCLRMVPAAVDACGVGADRDADHGLVTEPGFLAAGDVEGVPRLCHGACTHLVWASGERDRRDGRYSSDERRQNYVAFLQTHQGCASLVVEPTLGWSHL